jgi:hypothetical protein
MRLAERAARRSTGSATPQGDPWGLTYCDLVGFQTKNDRDNFADYLLRQGATQTRDGYEIDGRRVRLGAFPVSIETKAYMRLARNAGRSAMVALVRESLGGRPRPLSPQIDQALGNHAGAEQNRAESPGEATGARSNARMRMSAIGWPVAAILPLDNIGAM